VAAAEDDKDQNAVESEGAALWRRTVDALVAKGSTVPEAIVGANLILEAYKRQRATEPDLPAHHPQPNSEDRKTSGIRRRRPVGK
jgi:hypothetical protein